MEVFHLLSQQMHHQPNIQELQLHQMLQHIPHQQLNLQPLLMASTADRDVPQIPVPRRSRRGPSRRPRNVCREDLWFLDSSEEEKTEAENDDEIEVAAALFDLANMFQAGKQADNDSDKGWDAGQRAGVRTGAKRRRDEEAPVARNGRHRGHRSSQSPSRAPKGRGDRLPGVRVPPSQEHPGKVHVKGSIGGLHAQEKTAAMVYPGHVDRQAAGAIPKEERVIHGADSSGCTQHPTGFAVVTPSEAKLQTNGLPGSHMLGAGVGAMTGVPPGVPPTGYNASVLQHLAAVGAASGMPLAMGGSGGSPSYLQAQLSPQPPSMETLASLQALAYSWPLLPPAVATHLENMMGGPAAAQRLLLSSLASGPAQVSSAMAHHVAQSGAMAGMAGPYNMMSAAQAEPHKAQLQPSLNASNPGTSAPVTRPQSHLNECTGGPRWSDGKLHRCALHVHIAHRILQKQEQACEQAGPAGRHGAGTEGRPGGAKGAGGAKERMEERREPSPPGLTARRAVKQEAASELPGSSYQRTHLQRGHTPPSLKPAAAAAPTAAREASLGASLAQLQQMQQPGRHPNSMPSMSQSSAAPPDMANDAALVLPALKSLEAANNRAWNMTWCM